MKAALVLFSAVVTSAVIIVDKAKQSLLDYSNDLDHLGCQITWPTMKIVFSIYFSTCISRAIANVFFPKLFTCNTENRYGAGLYVGKNRS
jgi:hypothetical protein